MRRIILILLGLALTLGGALVLSNIVQQARDEALQGPGTGEVLVVKTLIPRLTPVAEIADSVETITLPTTAIAPGAVRSLEQLAPILVASTDLVPGEQVLETRFVNPLVVERLEIPEGLVEVTFPLEAARALGGTVIVGDRVGIIGSFEAPIEEGVTPPRDGLISARCSGSAICITDFVLHQILVTAVQYPDGTSVGTTDALVPAAPSGTFLVTVAVPTQEASTIVFAVEFGKLWLTRQGPGAIVGNEQPITLDRSYSGAQ